MKKSILKLQIFIIALSLLTYSCADLDVINENEPDAERALANPSDVMALAGGAFRTWHNIVQEYDGVALAMGVMADHITMSYGNQAMRDLSWEPRINSFNNSLTYAYFGTIREQWQESYSAISSVNLVLNRLYSGMEFGIDGEDTKLVEAFCLLTSGVSHGYLGLVFDKANVIPWDADIAALELKPWDEVVAASIALLDEAIAICNANTFDVPVAWFGGQAMNNVSMGKLASSYAARILASSSRTKAHNEALDWGKILTYTQNGITEDFAPKIGPDYLWYDMYFVYSRYSGWGRADMRIINQMDHSYPSRWPNDGVSWTTPSGLDPGPANPVDKRILSDFEYLASNVFAPDRGYYHFSHYRFKRYDYLTTALWYGNGIKPSFMAWENKLLQAEALLRTTGNTTGALAILNSPTGPRKVRGEVADITSTNVATVLRYILDEKDIECFLTGAGIPFYDMRRTDRLQPATLLHFPVPATELEISGLPHYTINAVADGIDGSAGNWTGWDN
jgi:starch-binding outer membrane protein, SusD/RagB family